MSWNHKLLHNAKRFANDMKRASWTTCDDAVTCPRCRAMIRDSS